MTLAAAVRRRLAQGAVPVRLYQEMRMEMRLAAVRWRARLDPRSRWRRGDFRGRREILLHFGCGTRALPGWLNVDGRDGSGVDLVWDLRQRLPLADGACRAIFTEHVFEHIEREFRPAVLAEFHRLLRPRGVVRIVGPDCRRFAEAYVRGDLEWFRQSFPGCAGLADGLNSVFVDHFHRFIDDFDTLARALHAAGFSTVTESKHRESAIPELRIDSENDARRIGNLYVEATR